MSDTKRPAGLGHNSIDMNDNASASRLKSYIDRIEKLESERSDLTQDIKEIYSEAKSAGFDVPTIRAIIRIKKIETEKRREAQLLLETYSLAVQLELF